MVDASRALSWQSHTTFDHGLQLEGDLCRFMVLGLQTSKLLTCLQDAVSPAHQLSCSLVQMMVAI